MTVRVRTGYSFRSAVGKIEDVIARLVEIGATHAPITDTASTFGWVKWKKAAQKANLKPVFGVELAVTPSIHEKKPSVDYWTFIAQDSIEPINDLVALATSQFRYQPLLTREQAWSRSDVWAIMGHRTDFSAIPSSDHLFVALGPSLPRGQLKRALAAGHRLIAASDNRYPAEGGQGFYETVCGRNASVQSYPQWILSDEEWLAQMEILGVDKEQATKAMINRDLILHRSTADLVQAEMVHPPRPMTLREMCEKGAQELGCDLTRPEYAARLDRELSLIAQKGYEDYFYLVADICQWARQRMIVGPARGSSCGSLVCYLLKITTVDPIPYGLLFERFIDINRNDMPDIDIDFPEHRRAEVFDYITKTYGQDRVARLGTVAMYQPRSALKEAAAAMDIPPWHLEPVLDAIIERSSGDSRALQATEDTLNDTEAGREFLAKYPEILVAAKMEGHPRHSGQHAAGIVITHQPVKKYVAVDQRTGATMCDKYDAEELNLLKIDALGLTQLSIFEHALQLAGLDKDHLFKIPLDDQAAFDVLNKGQYAGVFQFMGLALQSITDQIEVNSLEDIVAITALARPGPLNTGGTNRWIKARTGREPVRYAHPILEPYLKDNYGIVIYQEDVMRIGREVGDLSWEDVTALRKAMSKSLGEEFFGRFREKFVAGAVKNGMPEEIARPFFDDLSAFGSWAFNKAHALAYGLVSYYCCWLKAHYPVEFAAATLSHTDTPEQQIKMLRELAAEGVDYIPVDPETSTDKWTVKRVAGKNYLVGPLSNVHGVGPKMMATIIGARHRNEPLPERARKLLENAKTKVDSLYPIEDAFRKLLPNPAEKNIITKPTKIKDIQVTGQEQEVVVFCVVEQIKPKDENEDVNVAKRGGRRLTGPTQSLNLRIGDDTDVVFAKVNRWDYERIGRPIVERGRAGKALYVMKGYVPSDFRMLSVKNVRYIGDLDDV